MKSKEHDAAFWDWLRNKGKQAQKQEQPRLELPKPPAMPRPEREIGPRGICIIELF